MSPRSPAPERPWKQTGGSPVETDAPTARQEAGTVPSNAFGWSPLGRSHGGVMKIKRMRRSIAASIALVGALASAMAVIPTAATAGTDPLADSLWGLDQVRAEAAWARSTGANAVVAVIDSGVDLDHPDLATNVVPGISFLGC